MGALKNKTGNKRARNSSRKTVAKRCIRKSKSQEYKIQQSSVPTNITTKHQVKSNSGFILPYKTYSRNKLHDNIASDAYTINNSDDDITTISEKSSIESNTCVQTDNPNSACLDVEDGKNIKDEEIEGRRICNINFMLSQLHNHFDIHNGDCPGALKDLRLIKVTNSSMRSKLHFKCNNCNKTAYIMTDAEDESNQMLLEQAAVLGTITSGTGFAALQEQLAVMGIPCMIERIYRQHREVLADYIEGAAKEEIQSALEKEKSVAISENRVSNGIARLSVIVDSGWSHRSFNGSKMNALSCVAVMIGVITLKVIWYATMNKHCAVCAAAKRFSKPPTPHKCRKNCDENTPSSSMESSLLVKGICDSVETMNVAIEKIISDGDSNTFKAVSDRNPYKDLNIRIKKIECTNHLFRNFCKHIVAASKSPINIKLLRGQVTRIRAIVKTSALKMRRRVIYLIDRRKRIHKDNAALWRRKIIADILKMPYHIYGDHSKCLLVEKCDKKQENIMQILIRTGIFQLIERAIRRLAANVDSLILNVTNNPAEWFNSVNTKYNGGKRLNNSERSSFDLKSACAVLQVNTDGRCLSTIFKFKKLPVPLAVLSMETKRKKQVTRTKNHRLLKGRKRRFKHSTDKHYGPNSQQPDMDDTAFEEAKKLQMETLFKRLQNSDKILNDTMGQSLSDDWHLYRQDMITASLFKEVCRKKDSTSCAATVRKIIYPAEFQNKWTQYGLEKEEEVRSLIEKMLQKKISLCGLFIDKDKPYLGASPDGLIENDGLLEIKTFAKAFNMTPKDAVKTFPKLYKSIFTHDNIPKNKFFDIIFTNKKLTQLNKKHQFYYQVQGQLHITQRNYCVMAFVTDKGVETLTVTRDDAFWEKNMEKQLERFYMECVLPELINRRHLKGMPIREPQYIIDAKQEIEASKNKNSKTSKAMKKRTKPKCTIISNVKVITRKRKLSRSEINAIVSQEKTQKIDCTVQDLPWIPQPVSHELLGNDALRTLEAVYQIQITDESSAINNILKENGVNQWQQLSDSSIQLFLFILETNSCFQPIRVNHQLFSTLITPIAEGTPDLQIIGGNQSAHWYCLYYNGDQLLIYDSMNNRKSFDLLSADEQNFIIRRYPFISRADIVPKPVVQQPDVVSCGVYAAASATSVALGENPSDKNFSKNSFKLRQHLVKIIKNKTLYPFPEDN